MIIQVVLLSLFVCEISCVTCYTDVSCFDEDNFILCDQIGGIHDVSDITCKERGFDMGRCCGPPGNYFCLKSNRFACSVMYAFAGGTWRDSEDGDDCVCYSRYQSCCINGTCYNQVSEAGCASYDGIYNEGKDCLFHPCETTGACFSESKSTCFDVPESNCASGNLWEGEDSSCVVNHEDLLVLPGENNTGKCCDTNGCFETSDPENECLQSQYGTYYDGIGCSGDTSDSCWGACLYGDKCLRLFGSFCPSLNGNFFSGGICESDPKGRCIYRGTCEYHSKSTCIQFFDGIFEKDGVCEDYIEGPGGSCCGGGHCIYYNQDVERKCNTLPNDGFYPNLTCSEHNFCERQDDGKCCLLGLLCFHVNEEICGLYQEAILKFPIDRTIPYIWSANETCGDGCSKSISFSQDAFEVNSTIELDAADLNISQSNLTFKGGDFKTKNNSVVTITFSEMNIENFLMEETQLTTEYTSIKILKNFTIQNTVLHIKNTEIEVSNCLDIKAGSTLEVELNSTNSNQLIKYACVDGSFEKITIHTNNDCLKATNVEYTTFALIFSYDDICSSTTDEEHSGTLSNVIVYLWAFVFSLI